MTMVIKFGGEAVGSGKRIKNISKYLKKLDSENEKFIIVTSAMSNSTNKLVSIAKTAAGFGEENENDLDEKIQKIEKKYLKACEKAIGNKKIRKKTKEKIKEKISNLEKVVKNIEENGELTDKFLDSIVSFGERLTSEILSGAINDQNMSSKAYTGGEAGIITDDNHLDASPIMDKTERLVKERLEDKLKGKEIPVITGFIAETEKGEITTMGRGSSDYTASLIGSILEVDEVWIMSDVQGVMTADPKIEPNAVIIDKLSYMEAAELSHFGTEVLNPKTIRPAREKNIPVRVKNAFQPEENGTLVVKDSQKSEKIAKAITTMEEISIVTVRGPSMIGTSGVAAEVLKTLRHAGLKILMISQSSSQTDISLAIKRKDLKETLDVLRKEFDNRQVDWKIKYDKNASIVAIVGEGMKGTPGVAGRVFSTLGDKKISIMMISQGSSELNISFAVQEENVKETVRSLHKEFELNNSKN